MRVISCAALGLWLGLTGGVFAGTSDSGPQPVVVELFTSQGCSSCPPADTFLGELAKHDGVIALALHVDYWDYIGWKDGFGSAAFTARQKAYASAIGSRTIYTPQMIVEGDQRVVGFRPMEVAALIAQHRTEGAAVTLSLTRDGNRLHIHAETTAPLAKAAMVQLVRYIPEKTVSISRGENAGRTMEYNNIVTSWQKIANWDGTAPLTLDQTVSGDEPVVVIVQTQGPGRILAARRLP